MTSLDLRTCVINCETLTEQLRFAHWSHEDRVALLANKRIADSELTKARAELLADGFSLKKVNEFQQQFVDEYRRPIGGTRNAE